jgi:hypothetical protein
MEKLSKLNVKICAVLKTIEEGGCRETWRNLMLRSFRHCREYVPAKSVSPKNDISDANFENIIEGKSYAHMDGCGKKVEISSTIP